MSKFRSFSSALAAGVVGSLLWVGSASAQLITVQSRKVRAPSSFSRMAERDSQRLMQPPRVLGWVESPLGAPLVLMPGP